MITENEALKLGLDLLRENNLMDWTISITDRAKRRLGVCKYGKRLIEISSWTFDKCPEFVENTVRHEVAHALVGPGYGHGPVWKRAAIQLGAKPERCAAVPLEQRAPYKWILICPNCEKQCGGSYRRRTRFYLGGCCRVRLNQIKNYEYK